MQASHFVRGGPEAVDPSEHLVSFLILATRVVAVAVVAVTLSLLVLDADFRPRSAVADSASLQADAPPAKQEWVWKKKSARPDYAWRVPYGVGGG